MRIDRDRQLGAALRRLDVPAHRDGFFEAVWAGIDAQSVSHGAHSPARRWSSRLLWRIPAGRHRLRLSLAAAITVVVVAAVVLVGLPAGARVVERFFGGSTAQGPALLGPEPARADTAADVLRIAQRALRSARTITGDYSHWIGRPGSEPQFAHGIHVILAADGSCRVTADHDNIGWELGYDAGAGVSRVWRGDFWPTPSVHIETEEYIGIPPGEPDGGDSRALFSHPTPGGRGWQLFGAVARIARANSDGLAETGTFDGRPVWIVSCPVIPRAPEDPSGLATPTPGGSASPKYELSVSVDQQTGLPVRVQAWVDGRLRAEGRLSNVRVDEAVPEDTFTPGLPTAADVRLADDGRLSLWVDLGATTTIMPLPFDPETVSPDDVRVSIADTPRVGGDLGFRRTSIGQVRPAIGRAALVPAWLPRGFQLRCVAVKQRQRPSGHSKHPRQRALAGTGIVSLRYENGFQEITVTTRKLDPKLTSEQPSVELDPFIDDKWPGWTDSRTAIDVTGGTFAGARGMVVIAPLTLPHLWAVKDGMLLTVAGDATAAQLLAIADSMAPWEALGGPWSPWRPPADE